MRLYLTVIRNGLPAVKTVWPITEEQKQQTIAQLIENVNEHFPLDGEHWGLEDYVLTLAGFECLHYHKIDNVLQNGDEITVRPLRDGEIRGRTVSGRNSISANGRHLYDGVAFGGQSVRGPARADVLIPPRKRRKVSFEDANPTGLLQIEETTQDETVLQHGQVQEVPDSDHDADTDESEDSDFSVQEGDEASEDDSSEEYSESESEDEASAGDDNKEDDNESSDTSSDSSSDVSSDTSDSESDQDNVSISSWTGLEDSSDIMKQPGAMKATETPGSASRTITTKNALGQRLLMRSVADESSYTNGLQPGETDAAATTNDAPSHNQLQGKSAGFGTMNGIPHDGKPDTVKRNQRRRQSQKLKRLKQDGILDASATFQDLLAYEASSTDGDYAMRLEQKRQELIQALAHGGIDVTPSSAPHASEDEGPPDIESSKSDATGARQRAKLDIASSKRLVFGSLGVRVPRDVGEEEATRKRLATSTQSTVKERLHMLRQKRVDGVASESLQDVVDNAAEDDSWWDKISLRAVECCDTAVTQLSAPPFPFKQRWDPQFRGKKRKPAAITPTYDGYNNEGDYLDYDEPDESTDSSEGALEGGDTSDVFPLLPQELDSLPSMQSEQARQGDFVVDTILECNSETGWEPAFQSRTYRLLEHLGDGVWKVSIAPRDIPKINFDEGGRRVYSMLEMPGQDETEEQNKDEQLDLTSCHNARLLYRPA